MLAFLREIEHIEDNWLVASVFAMMDSVYHLYDYLTFMYHFLLAIHTYDGQLALHQNTVVHHRVVVSAKLLSGRKLIFYSNQLRASLKIIWQLYAIPALRGAGQFG